MHLRDERNRAAFAKKTAFLPKPFSKAAWAFRKIGA